MEPKDLNILRIISLTRDIITSDIAGDLNNLSYSSPITKLDKIVENYKDELQKRLQSTFSKSWVLNPIVSVNASIKEELVNEFSKEMTTGISAPPMGSVNKIPYTSATANNK